MPQHVGISPLLGASWLKTTRVGLFASSSFVQTLTDVIEIPSGRAFPPPEAPIFWGAAKKDYVCIPAQGDDIFKPDAFDEGQVTRKEYDADHWMMLSEAETLSCDLIAWIDGFER